MISRIRGQVVSREPGSVEVLTGAGLVYEVHVPLSVFQRLPGEGEELELLTVFAVREDAHALFGFLDDRERTLFTRLTSVQKIGARLGLAMMSMYHAGRLVRILAEGDVRALVQVGGVGKKTAERIVLELGDKVQDLAASDDYEGAEATTAAEAVKGLVSLGYSFADAEAAVRDAMAAADDGPEGAEDVVRRVLARRTGAD